MGQFEQRTSLSTVLTLLVTEGSFETMSFSFERGKGQRVLILFHRMSVSGQSMLVPGITVT